MVLRGSKTKPDFNTIEVKSAMEDVKAYLRQTNEEIEALETELVHTLEDFAHKSPKGIALN